MHIWKRNSLLHTTQSNISSAAGASDSNFRHTAPPINVFEFWHLTFINGWLLKYTELLPSVGIYWLWRWRGAWCGRSVSVILRDGLSTTDGMKTRERERERREDAEKASRPRIIDAGHTDSIRCSSSSLCVVRRGWADVLCGWQMEWRAVYYSEITAPRALVWLINPSLF